MQVIPINVAVEKTKRPIIPEKKSTIIERKIKMNIERRE
jgi:hypothetical protein